MKPSICLFKWLCLFLYEVVSVTLNAGVLLDTLQFALPSIAFGLTVTLYYSLSRAFGHGFGYTVGIVFLPFIFVPLLGVGRSRYTDQINIEINFKKEDVPKIRHIIR